MIDEREVNKLRSALNCTRTEAIEILMQDKAIDKGEIPDYTTSADLKDSMAMSEKAITNPKSPKTSRYKVDDEKAQLIADIAEFLAKNSSFDIAIVKTDKEISIKSAENDYTLTLTKHRKPKTA